MTTVAPDFTIRLGDTKPILLATLQLPAGTPIDLSNANTVILFLRYQQDSSVLLSLPMSIDNATTGQVSYSWQATDLTQAGLYDMEIQIAFADGSTLSVPNDHNPVLLALGDIG